MKRLRSSDDLDSHNEKATSKDSSNPNPNRSSSSSHRSFYYKSDNVRKGLVSPSSSSRYDRDRSLDEDNRMVRKRPDHDFDSFDRRKGGFDRYSNRDGAGSGNERAIHRSESFCGTRREFPKGFRSERDRREGSVSSWRRFSSGSKDFGSGNKEFEGNSREERGGCGKGLRDMMKSPSWSRDSGSEQSRVRGLGDSKSMSKSKSRSSPTWSKDSVGSEQAKSLEVVKKRNEFKVESGSSSEMEEGELEPEAVCEMEEGQGEPYSDSGMFEIKNDAKENNVGVDGDNKAVEDEVKMVKDVEIDGNEEKQRANKVENDELHETGELPGSMNLHAGTDDGRDEKESVVADEVGKEQDEGLEKVGDCNVEGSNDIAVAKSLSSEEPSKALHSEEPSKALHSEEPSKALCSEEPSTEEKGNYPEEIEVPESNKVQIMQENGEDKVNEFETEGLIQNFKDKGKSVAVSPIHIAQAAEDGALVERDSRVTLTWKADDMEGPSTRGFDLFTSSPVRKAEDKPEVFASNKAKDEILELEPLDLSLSLPNVLLPIGTTQAPGSPSHGGSVHSLTNTFRTNSDGFTASMSFSGSQLFSHNPSCSLTQNSMDNFEQSVHSRPIFHGIDQVSQGAWQGQSQNDSTRHKEIPLYQKILMNGNGSSHHSQASLQGIPNGQLAPGQHVRVSEGSAKVPNGQERQLSFHKQNDARSPSNGIGSHDIGSNYSFEKKRAMREKHGGVNLYRSSSQKEQEFLIGGVDFVETIISRIVSDPIHVMARKFHEMTGQSIQCFKESIREIMLNVDKKAQLLAFQNALHCRSDMNIEVLLKCHRAHLEILVALKTGLPEYLQLDNGITSTDLAEVFLNLRCRNLTCWSPLPVDECDCKVCAKKNGFCSACMCLLCSKFDMASNTCSWVGCDVCLHWCHVDCGLRESYIRNGRSATGDGPGAQGLTEMQFHCVACDHPSEMFGFVKEVFQHFAKDWSAERMSKELEYVKRIFYASKDVRGRRLHDIADQMLVRLSNKSDLPDFLNYIVGFLTDSESSKSVSILEFPDKERVKGSNGITGPSHDTSWLKSVYSDKSPQLEGSACLLPSFHVDRNDKCTLELELPKSAQKEPLFDELESIVRIKQAEAKMFQSRADDARREAEGLKRIASAKSEKIEEEYTSRITRLRLLEAEEARKQKFEEFQALERAYREYFNMKMRMEADIKDLLMKMEATRRNLAM